MSDHITYVTDQNFDTEVIQSKIPVLVDFWAEWCGPCRMVAPILDRIAPKYTGKLKIVKVNVDESPESPKQYGVRGIPTLLLIKAGQVAATQVGALTETQLTAFIDGHI